jgi:hypothetical protein
MEAAKELVDDRVMGRSQWAKHGGFFFSFFFYYSYVHE